MKIADMTTRAFWKGEVEITGLVEDQGTTYKAVLGIKGSQINSCSCSCAQGYSYKGLCPHEKALFAHYKQQMNEEGGKTISTSSQVRAMIREYTNREVARIVQENEEGQVDFQPRLFISRQGVRAGFKVGRKRYYILKDLVSFAKAVETGAFVEYGKQLAFHHNEEIFREGSRPVLRFVLECLETYQEHYEQFQRSAYTAAPVLRELPLSRGNMDRFFAMMRDQTLETEDYRTTPSPRRITTELPDIRVFVKKMGKEGIRVWLEKTFISFTGETHLYLADKDCIYCCDEGFSSDCRVFFEQMTQGMGAPYEVQVHEKDIPLFYERVLKKLEGYGILKTENINLEDYRPQELKARFELDSPGASEIVLHPVLSYGSYTFHPVEDDHVPRTICRDVPGEFRISQILTKYFRYKDPRTNDMVIRDDEEAMYQFLSRGIEELKKTGEVHFSDQWSHLKVVRVPQVSVGIRAKGDWLELTVDTAGMEAEELQKILMAYRQKKSYYRLRQGEFLKLDDQGLITVARMMDGLGLSKEEWKQEQILVPKYRAFYLDQFCKEKEGIHVYRDQLFKAVVRSMKSVEDSDFEVPAHLAGILRGYQKTGFRWLRTLDAWGFGGILADDMGLGKTLQIIALLADEKEKQKDGQLSLIVCPASLVYNWEYEFQKFAPEIRVATITGNSQERELLLKEYSQYDVLITSYDLLKRDIAWYEDLSFRFQIIDEAQYIKNPGTQSARRVKMIQSKTRFALTGTPVENRLSELWSIFDYLMPGFLYAYTRFRQEYEQPIAKEGDEEKIQALRQLTGPFILRRLKNDVLKELPEKLETVVYSRLEKEQRNLYTASAYRLKQQLEGQNAAEYGAGQLQILSELTRLRQICCDPSLYYDDYKGGSAKLETCMEMLLNGAEGGHKILLFSQFTSMLDILGKRLKKEGLSYYLLTGATPKEERLTMVNAFQKDQTPIFLISLKAGGTGLNLTAADVVIHYDPWWNVAAQNQATDRAHRIGQDKQVSVFKLITRDTIEENILKLQEAKKHLAEQIITEGTISLASLSKEDLLEMLS